MDLTCERVSRFFGEQPVLRDVSFACPAGSVWALWGPNGAGKTTLLRILAGALRPSRGGARLGGEACGSAAARRQTGFLSHQSLLQPALTVEENLRFYATLFGLDPPRSAVAGALQRVRGEALAPMRVGELSQGMRQKAALARCLLHRPRLLLLDEPFASLDRATIEELRACLRELRAAGTTVLVSSHQEEPVSGLLDGAITLERGRLAEARAHV